MSISKVQKFEYKEEEDDVYKYFVLDYVPVANREKVLALIEKYNEEADRCKYPKIVYDNHTNQIHESGTIGKMEKFFHSSRYKGMMAKKERLFPLLWMYLSQTIHTMRFWKIWMMTCQQIFKTERDLIVARCFESELNVVKRNSI